MTTATSGLTVNLIERARPGISGTWLSDTARRGEGRLVLRLLPSGARLFYYRATNAEGRRDLVPIGSYVRADGDAKGTFTIKQARERAVELRGRHRANRNVKAVLVAEKRQAELRTGTAPEEQTFASLLAVYVAKLKARDAVSWKAIEAAFQPGTYIPAWMLETRASDITRDHLVAVLRPLIQAGKKRQAAKLRSYFRAAFAVAMKAPGDPEVAGIDFGLTVDPSAHIGQIEEHTRAGNRTLDETELAAWVKAVWGLEHGPVRDALLLSLWLGGQRPTQVLRAMITDVDLHLKSITLTDRKGRRKKPRRWTLPLTATPLALVKAAAKRANGSSWLFVGPRGAPVRIDKLDNVVRPLIAKMVEDKVVRAPFRLGDVRRSVETQMQALGVPRDVRGYLASHGLGGVQAAHYERYEYQAEVRLALTRLSRWLAEITLG